MYKLSNKKVTIKGKKYKAYFPNKHSRVSGIVIECWDENAGDSYANITDYHSKVYVLWKGDKDWKEIHNGKGTHFNVNGVNLDVGDGLNYILIELESENVKNKDYQKKEIMALKKKISDDTKRLKELVKE